jgi:nicotinate phosphoribosyltransferase
VRLDSGDLDSLSRDARDVLDRAGMQHVRIFASGGLDEFEIDRLVGAGAPIDAFGVGTRMGVSSDAPTLDSAYKLVEYDGRPILKLSKDKTTAPGPKQVYRGPEGDTIGLRDEEPPDDREPLLVPVMLGGQRTGPRRTLETARMHFRTDLEQVPEAERRIADPLPHEPATTEALERLAERARTEALERAGLREA